MYIFFIFLNGIDTLGYCFLKGYHYLECLKNPFFRKLYIGMNISLKVIIIINQNGVAGTMATWRHLAPEKSYSFFCMFATFTYILYIYFPMILYFSWKFNVDKQKKYVLGLFREHLQAAEGYIFVVTVLLQSSAAILIFQHWYNT